MQIPVQKGSVSMTQSGRYLILVLNPGSTSTKVGLFEDDTCVFSEDVFHDSSVLLTFPTIQNQLDFRMQVVESFLIQHQVDLKNVDAFVGRGGPCHSVEGGVYAINDLLIQDTIHCVGGLYHASLLGVLMADRLQKRYGGLLLMVAPPVVDELCDLARVTGIRGVYRRAISHALNLKATARFHAESLGRRYEDMNLIVCHIDGGISITAHEKGRMIDGNNAGGGEGPLSPTRMGSLAVTDLLLFLKKHSTEEVRHLCSQSGGFSSHFGTSDIRQIHRRMEEGDVRAKRVYDAMIYQICKDIGAMAAVLRGKVDGIVLTGGLVRYQDLVDNIRERCGFIADISVYPGEREHEAMALGALRVLRGEMEARIYPGHPVFSGFPEDAENS